MSELDEYMEWKAYMENEFEPTVEAFRYYKEQMGDTAEWWRW